MYKIPTKILFLNVKGRTEDEVHVRDEYVSFHVHVHDVFGHDAAISHPLIGVRPEEPILPLPVFFLYIQK